MKKEGFYSSGEFARMAHVTVRTIRYYDSHDILKPSFVNESGARFYTDEDFTRLQQILLLKFLGFSLNDIKNMTIGDMDYHFLSDSLEVQLKLVRDKIEQLQLVEKAIEDTSGEIREYHTVNWNKMLELIHRTHRRPLVDRREPQTAHLAFGGQQFAAESVVQEIERPRRVAQQAAALRVDDVDHHLALRGIDLPFRNAVGVGLGIAHAHVIAVALDGITSFGGKVVAFDRKGHRIGLHRPETGRQLACDLPRRRIVRRTQRQQGYQRRQTQRPPEQTAGPDYRIRSCRHRQKTPNSCNFASRLGRS